MKTIKKDVIKKQNEFSQAYPIFERFGIDKSNIMFSEKPDFVFQRENKTIGLEVIECHPSSILSKNKVSLVRAYSRLDMICREYEAKLIQEGMEHVCCTLIFTDKCIEEISNIHINLSDIKRKIFEEIRKFREKNEFPNPMMWYRTHDRKYCTFKYVDLCKIRTIPNCRTFVTQMKGYICRTVENESIQHCITYKEKKLEQYVKMEKNKDIDEYWLCINVPTETGRYFDYVTYEHHSTYQQVFLTQNSDIKQLNRCNSIIK